MTGWFDDIQLIAEISSQGSWVSAPVATAWPFEQWSAVDPPTNWAKSVVGTTSLWAWYGTGNTGITTMRSNSLNTQLSTAHGINRYFWLDGAATYQVSVKVRGHTPPTGASGGDAARGATSGPVLVVGKKRAGDASPWTFTSNNTYRTDGLPDSENWYELGMSVVTAANEDQIRIDLQCSNALDHTGQWGVDWKDLSITKVKAYGFYTEMGWYAVQCETMDASIRYGRTRFTERYDVGTAAVRLNNVTGKYQYQISHPLGFRPGRMFRLQAKIRATGVMYPLFYGVIDRIATEMTLDGKANVTLTVFDTTSFTSDTKTPNLWIGSYAIVGGDPLLLSGNRVNALLDSAGVAQSFRSIATGVFPMQNVAESSRSIREEIGVTADSEGGSFFAERDGTIVYRDRNWVDGTYATQVQANFNAYSSDVNIAIEDGVVTAPGAPTICPFNMATDWSMERVINQITLAVAGGSKMFYANAYSQSQYGIATYQRLDYVNKATTSYSVATMLNARANDLFTGSLNAELRVQRLEYRPGNNDGWVFALSAFLDWSVRVMYYMLNGTWGFSTVVRIQSVEHRISPTDWVIAYNLDQPSAYLGTLTPLEDGGWDRDNWDQGDWDSP